MTAPLLTVGMPVYNGEPFLRQALDSIAAQTFTDYRLVVSDNGSTDGTADIVRDYAREDDRIQLVGSPENRGAAWNYNNAFAHCTTPFFRWAAADDELAPTCLERCLAALEDAPGAVLAYPLTRMIDEDGTVLGDISDGLACSSRSPSRRLWHVVQNAVWGSPIFGVVRSEALRKTQLHGAYASADYVLFAELALLGELKEVPEPLFLRRMHSGMSRQANVTPDEIAQWFDPGRQPVRHELANLYWRHLVAVRHARLPVQRRLVAAVVLTAAWARRYNRLRRRTRRLLKRARS